MATADELPLSVKAVMSNCDLLTEILLRLPVLSLLLFKSVSKPWYSIITSPIFIDKRNIMPKIDPPSGLIIRRIKDEYDFNSFDIRIPSKRSIVLTLGSEAPHGGFEILQSCNGLLLCCIGFDKFCVYNPTIKLFRMLPKCSLILSVFGTRLAFDPTKSLHYKVIRPAPLKQVYDDGTAADYYTQLETYSSKTDKWIVCGGRFPVSSFHGFEEGIYWNGAIHWLHTSTWDCYKLDIVDEHLVFSEIQLPETLDRNSHIRFKLFESRGCLLLFGKDNARPKQLNIYEMRNGNYGWQAKYIVNLDDVMMSFPNFWPTSTCVWCIVLGEREEDCFMIFGSFTKVVQYYLVSKTARTLCDLKPIYGFQFIPSFAGSNSVLGFRSST